MCVFFLKRTLIGACQFCKINSLQSLQLLCQQFTIKVIPPKSSKGLGTRQKIGTCFILRRPYLKSGYQSEVLCDVETLVFRPPAMQYFRSCCDMLECSFMFCPFIFLPFYEHMEKRHSSAWQQGCKDFTIIYIQCLCESKDFCGRSLLLD